MHKIKNTIIYLTLSLTSLKTAFAEIDVNIDLLPRPGDDKWTDPVKELQTVSNLPEISVESAVTTVIKTILTFSMALALITLVVMGIYYLKAMGNEEEIGKVKNMMIYLVIGMAIIAAAYGVVVGVAQFDFFR